MPRNMASSFIVVISFLFELAFSQGGGDGGGGGSGGGDVGGGGSDSSSCSSCCLPGDPVSALGAIYGCTFIAGSLIVLFLAVFFAYRWIYSPNFLSHLMKNYLYKGDFPDSGVYHGHYFQYGRYYPMDNITLTFHDSVIEGSGTDTVGSYDWRGRIYKDRPIKLEKTYRKNTGDPNENFGHTVAISLIPTRILGSFSPALFGYFFVRRNNTKGIWFIIPKEVPYEIDNFFPAGRSKKEISVFLCIMGVTLGMIGNYSANKTEFYDNIYSEKVIGVTWGAFFSILGLVLLFFWEDVFKFRKNRPRNLRVWLFLIYFAIAILCMTFAIIDMIGADFVGNQNLVTTDNGCSVVWEAPLTLQDDSCLGETKTLCVSFASAGADCGNERSHLFSYLFINSILGFLLMVLWEMMMFLLLWLKVVRWTDIQTKFKKWNKGWDLEPDQGPLALKGEL